MTDQSKKAYKLLDAPEGSPRDVSSAGTATTTNTRLVNAAKAANVGAFHCSACDATFTSYDAYLDHTHSRLHQHNIGAQTVERVDDPTRIRERLSQLREQRTERERQKKRLLEDPVAVVQERIEQRRLQEETERQRQRELKQQQQQQKNKSTKRTDTEVSSEEAALMASVLGITSFK